MAVLGVLPASRQAGAYAAREAIMRKSLTLVIGGEAGQGLATVGELLARMLSEAGHHFVTFQGYHSRIRGGHNTFAIKISPAGLSGPEDQADLVLSLNEETDIIDGPRLRPEGLLLAFGRKAQVPPGASMISVPFGELSKPRELNIAALGILTGILSLPLAKASLVVDDLFKNKGGSENPLRALKAGYYWAEANKLGGRCQVSPASPGHAPRLILNGNEALALGAAAGGANFCSFYPMSPATSVALSLADWAAKAGLVVEQAEDEIAAANMAIGASYAGASAVVPTSGGGFALMSEAVSLAGMTESPIVFIVVQRPGPATGLPTRTEQADLNLTLYAGHGEFPRAILAPSSTEECFNLAFSAMRLAEESQGPVFLLSDQYLADCTRPIEPFDFASLPEPVNTVEIHERNAAALKAGRAYQRYKLGGPDGLSPRLLPGFSDHLVKVDSDEHGPDGHITEDLNLRQMLQDKRLSKMGGLRARVLAPDWHGPEDAETILVTWGSSLGAGLDAVAELERGKKSVALLHFKQLYPLDPSQWLPKFERAKRVVFAEGNAEGQFAQLVRRETGFNPKQRIKRYDGLPLTGSYIAERLEVK